jgi:hypothetical protein
MTSHTLPEGSALFVSDEGHVAIRHADGSVEPLAQPEPVASPAVVEGEIIATGESTVVSDPGRQPFDAPCQDCKRAHLRGEHVAYTVPRIPTEDDDSTERVAWEGCVDCWERRTRRTSDLATPPYVHRLLDVLIYGGGLKFDEGMEVPHDVLDRLVKADDALQARRAGPGRRRERRASTKAKAAPAKTKAAPAKGVAETIAEARP